MKNVFWCLCIGLTLFIHLLAPVSYFLESEDFFEALIVWNWWIPFQVYLAHIGLSAWLYCFYRKSGCTRLTALGCGALAAACAVIAESTIVCVFSNGELPPAAGVYYCFPFAFAFTVQFGVCTVFRMLYVRRNRA